MCPTFSQVSTFLFRCAKQRPLYRVQICHPQGLVRTPPSFAHYMTIDMHEVCHLFGAHWLGWLSPTQPMANRSKWPSSQHSQTNIWPAVKCSAGQTGSAQPNGKPVKMAK